MTIYDPNQYGLSSDALQTADGRTYRYAQSIPNGVDFIEHETDDAGPPRNWRLATPPPGYDGTIPDVAATVTKA